ncbi:MAG: selenium-binding protein [Planctomycetota bacterium]|nr:MAG: selenium-binding protein [Planctomycetota bacterium]
MKRRHFIRTSGLAGLAAATARWPAADGHGPQQSATTCCDRTYATVQDAIRSPRETLAYVPGIYAGTGVEQPDYLATIDVDPSSKNYGRVIHRLPMPNVGDELHHFGWNACSSCHGQEGSGRRYIILPGLASGRIHVVDTIDPETPRLTKVIEPEEVARKANLSAPHTVHCLADGTVMISCLGNADGSAPGGFLSLDAEFNVMGRWERDATGMEFNYDFWYQPRQGVMVSSEWGAPNTVSQGFRIEDVQAGKYGRHLHFWDWAERKIIQSVDLGESGMIPLEVRFHHDPNSTHGFVGAALSSTVWHWFRAGDRWDVEQVIAVDPVETEGWPFPVPGLVTDIVLSMDDRFLYFSNWLHGDVRQYDVSDPSRPRLTGQVWLGGVIGHRTERVRGRHLGGGPQMLQLSLDGRRLYVTNSLYSPWDNQFYPAMAREGSYLVQLDCDTSKGGLTLNPDFLVDFGREPQGPARAHEIRFPGGDCTSDIWS